MILGSEKRKRGSGGRQWVTMAIKWSWESRDMNRGKEGKKITMERAERRN
jgi:hypothetical protein